MAEALILHSVPDYSYGVGTGAHLQVLQSGHRPVPFLESCTLCEAWAAFCLSEALLKKRTERRLGDRSGAGVSIADWDKRKWDFSGCFMLMLG